MSEEVLSEDTIMPVGHSPFAVLPPSTKESIPRIRASQTF